MTTKQQIEAYLTSLPEAKQADMRSLHARITKSYPKCRLWFLDGTDEKGKVVSNPNIGYGAYTMQLAGGKSREFYQVGISANTTGISVYIMGLNSKTYLHDHYATSIGKASLSGYCIKFKALKDLNMEVLMKAVDDRFSQSE